MCFGTLSKREHSDIDGTQTTLSIGKIDVM